MKVNISPTLWAHKEIAGKSPIALSITGGGKRTYHATGINVDPKNWKDGKITKGEKHYDILNAKIAEMINWVVKELLLMEAQGLPYDLNTVKEMLRPGAANRVDFYRYAEKVIAGKNASTKRRYTCELDKLKEYAGNSLSFAQISPEWLTAYYKYLTTENGEKSANHHNTAINAFKVIRHIFNEARDEKLIRHYPFTDWKYPQYKMPVKTYLTTEECDKLYKLLERDDISDPLKLVTAFFLLECYAGLRVSDWGKISIEQIAKDRELIFTTTKTSTPVRLPLDLMPSLSKVVDYIEKNKLVYTLGGEFANLKLKDIGPLAGIKGKTLTTHVGRHTFATQMLSIGASKEAIGMAMGITSRQVDTYAKLSANKLRNELTRLGGGV